MKARFIGSGSDPLPGTVGTCGATNGFSDPESAEQGAFWFIPDGSENAYYVDPERDLEILDGRGEA